MTLNTTPSVRRRAALWCLVPFALMAAACSTSDITSAADPVEPMGEEVASTAPQTDESAESDEVSWLASQTSESGRIEFTDGRATRLVLEGVDAHTIMFSDRPDRLTDVVDTAAITEQWEELFADSAPNAVLVEHRPDGETDSLVVVLTNPVFDAATRTLSYDIEVLADEDHPESVSGLTGEVHEEPPSEFLAASLFIDNMTSVDDYYNAKALAAADEMEREAEEANDAIDDPAYAVEDRADEMG